MSFRNTIDPTIGKVRKNAGKSYQESVPTTDTDNLISPVRMFRKNAGKVYESTPSQQIIEVVKPQLMRVGGKPRGSGGAIADTKTALQNKTVFYLSLDSNASQTNGFLNSNFQSGNAPTNTTGKVGNCYSFDGVNQHITDNNNFFNLRTLKEFTLSFWFYPNNNTGFGVPISKGSGGSVSQWELHCFHSQNTDFYGFYFAWDGTNFKSVSWNGFTINNWWHCIIKYRKSTGTILLKVNNDQKSIVTDFSTTSNIVAYGNAFRIGGTADRAFFFNGRVDEVLLLSTYTSDSEDDWLYNSGNGNSLV